MPLDAITITISREELSTLIKERERKLKAELQEAYIEEFNDLLARMKADGFSVISNGCRSVQRAEAWKCDSKNHFIDIIS